MTNYTSHYPPAYNTTYVKSTSYYTPSFLYPWLSADPGNPLTGSNATQWSSNGTAGSEKYNIDHGEAFRAARIYIENSHISGGTTNRGVKNVSLYGTNVASAFENITYATTTDLTLLKTFQVAQHVNSDVADPQYFLITGNSTNYRYSVLRIADAWGGTYIGFRRIEIQSENLDLSAVGAFLDQNFSIAKDVYDFSDQVFGLKFGSVLDQNYELVPTYIAILAQVYGLKFSSLLSQIYFDAPVIKRYLDQPYHDADQLKRSLIQKWGDAARIFGIVEQPYSVPDFIAKSLDQRYAIMATEHIRYLESVYNLSEYNLLNAKLEQPYVIAPAGSLYYHPTITVTVGGVEIHPAHINIEGSRDEHAMTCELTVYDQVDYLVCPLLGEIVITVDADEFTFLVNPKPSRNRNVGETTYSIKGESRSILLDIPFALPLTGQIGPGMASVLAIGLAAASGVTLVWEIVDWYIPVDVLYANDETPLTVIRKIAEAAGAILQSDPDGTLRVTFYYPCPVPDWGITEPDYYLSDQDNFFTLAENPETRPGYNKYTISDQLTAQKGVTYEEKQISATVKDVYVYQVPWDGIYRPLLHSGGSWVTIEPMGATLATITAEQQEIVNGTGKTSKPIYAMVDRDYKQAVLGAISFSEDGTLATEVPGQSLVELTYQTMYWRFRVTDPNIESVQCYVEDLEI